MISHLGEWGGSNLIFSGALRRQRTAQIALLACLIASLGLSACGRKGGLDAPPGASIVQPPPAQSAELGPDGQPVQVVQPAPPPPRGTLLDWLID
jgi:predicted small lipoprotein YifL